jgi:hypothetical protein
MSYRIIWEENSFVSPNGEDIEQRTDLMVLEFDAVERYSQQSKASVSQYTVQEGLPLTDHKRRMPVEITLDAVVTNSPLDTPGQAGQRKYTARLIAAKDKDGNAVDAWSEEFDRVQDCWDILQRLVSEAQFVTLETPQKVWQNFTVKSVSDDRTAGRGDVKAVRFSIGLQEVLVGTTRRVRVRVPTRQPRAGTDEVVITTPVEQQNPPAATRQRSTAHILLRG